jgi:hypothetical protein
MPGIIGSRGFFFVPLAIEEHKDQNKQQYIFARHSARVEKLVGHINARAAYVKNVQE